MPLCEEASIIEGARYYANVIQYMYKKGFRILLQNIFTQNEKTMAFDCNLNLFIRTTDNMIRNGVILKVGNKV